MRVKGRQAAKPSISGQSPKCPLNHPKHRKTCYAYSIDTQALPEAFTTYYVATELNDSLVTELESDSMFESLCIFYTLSNDNIDYDDIELGHLVNDDMIPLLSSEYSL